MTIVQIELPTALGERVQQHQEALIKLLEKTLDTVEQERNDLVPIGERSEEERLMAALRAAGVINPISVAQRQRYMREREQLDWQPITIAGRPLSEDIIEARRIVFPRDKD